MINNGKQPTIDTIKENGELLNEEISDFIRSQFDNCITSKESMSWVILAKLHGYNDLSIEMEKDIDSEVDINFNFDFGNENIPDENIDPDTY